MPRDNHAAERAAAYNNRGLARKERGDLDGALADFEKAVALNPNDAATYANRGLAHHALGNMEAAIADYDLALHLSPGDATVHYNRAVAYRLAKEPEQATADARKVLTLTADPNLRHKAEVQLQELAQAVARGGRTE